VIELGDSFGQRVGDGAATQQAAAPIEAATARKVSNWVRVSRILVDG
jgi:hypothetical protein